MRIVRLLFCLAAAMTLSGCVVARIALTAAEATASAVGTAVEAGADAVSAGVDALTDDEEARCKAAREADEPLPEGCPAEPAAPPAQTPGAAP